MTQSIQGDAGSGGSLQKPGWVEIQRLVPNSGVSLDGVEVAEQARFGWNLVSEGCARLHVLVRRRHWCRVQPESLLDDCLDVLQLGNVALLYSPGFAYDIVKLALCFLQDVRVA